MTSNQLSIFAVFTEQRGVLRGCVDRLLLFGLDDDVRSVLSAYTNQHVCRETNRKILRLYPLSGDSDVVSSSNGVFVQIRVVCFIPLRRNFTLS